MFQILQNKRLSLYGIWAIGGQDKCYNYEILMHESKKQGNKYYGIKKNFQGYNSVSNYLDCFGQL